MLFARLLMKPKFTWRMFAAAAVIAIAAYLASFVMTQKVMTVTFLVDGRFCSVEVHYFSRHAGLNRFLFMSYWPLHRQRSEHWVAFEKALFERDQDEELARLKLRRIYVRDAEVCRRAGLIGFRRE